MLDLFLYLFLYYNTFSSTLHLYDSWGVTFSICVCKIAYQKIAVILVTSKEISFEHWSSGYFLFLVLSNNELNWIDELFLWYGWPTKGVYPYFQTGPLSEILTTSNLWHTGCRIWTCAEREFKLAWMKLCSSDNHYTNWWYHGIWYQSCSWV